MSIELIGKLSNTTDSRATCDLVTSNTQHFNLTGDDKTNVEIYESLEKTDCAGFVIKITSTTDGFLPHAISLENGLEIHIAGDIEAHALINALRGALISLGTRSTRRAD